MHMRIAQRRPEVGLSRRLFLVCDALSKVSSDRRLAGANRNSHAATSAATSATTSANRVSAAARASSPSAGQIHLMDGMSHWHCAAARALLAQTACLVEDEQAVQHDHVEEQEQLPARQPHARRASG